MKTVGEDCVKINNLGLFRTSSDVLGVDQQSAGFAGQSGRMVDKQHR